MNQTTDTIKGRTLIAQFMGAVKETEMWNFSSTVHCAASDGMWLYEPGRYHESWDWIIPVFQKWMSDVCNMVPFKIYESAYNHFKKLFYQCIEGNDNEAAARTMVQAIQWYNSNTPS